MSKDRKRRRKKKGRSSGVAGGAGSGSGGGLMQGMARGFRRAAGVEKTKEGKSSILNNILWVVLIAAAAAFAVSRFTR